MEFVVVGIAILISIAIGVVIGIFVGMERMRKAIGERTMGWLRIDHSVPDEPAQLFVELKDVTPDMIANDKFVVFEVINESYLSHD